MILEVMRVVCKSTLHSTFSETAFKETHMLAGAFETEFLIILTDRVPLLLLLFFSSFFLRNITIMVDWLINQL